LTTSLLPDSKAFRVLFAGNTEHVVTAQGASFRAHIDFAEAMKRLAEIDVLVIPGGGTDKMLKTKDQPFTIIKAFTELQKKNPARERTLMSVCTGSLFLAELGVLSGLAATTHPDYVTKMEIIWYVCPPQLNPVYHKLTADCSFSAPTPPNATWPTAATSWKPAT